MDGRGKRPDRRGPLRGAGKGRSGTGLQQDRAQTGIEAGPAGSLPRRDRVQASEHQRRPQGPRRRLDPWLQAGEKLSGVPRRSRHAVAQGASGMDRQAPCRRPGARNARVPGDPAGPAAHAVRHPPPTIPKGGVESRGSSTSRAVTNATGRSARQRTSSECPELSGGDPKAARPGRSRRRPAPWRFVPLQAWAGRGPGRRGRGRSGQPAAACPGRVTGCRRAIRLPARPARSPCRP